MPRVNTLAWDGAAMALYVGGTFTFTAGARETTGYSDAPPMAASPGLAAWSESSGLQPFPGGGLYVAGMGGAGTGAGAGGVAFQIAFEPRSTSLFVAGSFDFVGSGDAEGGGAPQIPCQSIAVWQRRTNEWRCLYQVGYFMEYGWRS